MKRSLLEAIQLVDPRLNFQQDSVTWVGPDRTSHAVTTGQEIDFDPELDRPLPRNHEVGRSGACHRPQSLALPDPMGAHSRVLEVVVDDLNDDPRVLLRGEGTPGRTPAHDRHHCAQDGQTCDGQGRSLNPS
jgi:hypothetical protein